jgi:hypothetical protein
VAARQDSQYVVPIVWHLARRKINFELAGAAARITSGKFNFGLPFLSIAAKELMTSFEK